MRFTFPAEATQLSTFRTINNMEKEFMITSGLYFLQVGSAKSAWKKWQTETFRVAQKHDRCIFSKQGILDLYAELVEHARAFRNYQEGDIRQPDFEFAEKYGQNVGLLIGPDCYLSFIPVAGYYAEKDGKIRRVDLEAWHNHFDEKRGGAK